MNKKAKIPLLQVNNLGLSFIDRETEEKKVIINNVSFNVNRGEILGIVGESGTGKSLTALSIFGLTDDIGAQLLSGEIIYSPDGTSQYPIFSLSKKDIIRLRRNHFAMIFQEPLMSINENKKCGKQLIEILSLNDKRNNAQKKKTILEYLEKVGLSDVDRIYNSYPFEISGGQLQRIMIIMAICNHPKLVIADEPTTSLDVAVQKKILDLLVEIKQELELTIIYISHDLAVIKEIADSVLIMKDGEVVEEGSNDSIFKYPQLEYTQSLIDHHTKFTKAIPQAEVSRYSPILCVKELTKKYIYKKNWRGVPVGTKVALNDISFKMYKGEILGVVGESGSGKSTLAKAITQLIAIDTGEIKLDGKSIFDNNLDRKKLTKKVQIIFQDPFTSLNPRMTVGEIIIDALSAHSNIAGKTLINKAQDLLLKVGLSADYMNRYPHQLSGGQRQRIALTRALSIEPEILICDEPVSALDITVQDQIIQLLIKLNKDLGLTILLISHDLSLMRNVANRLIIMKEGRIVEEGLTEEVFTSPKSPYTRELIAAVPGIS